MIYRVDAVTRTRNGKIAKEQSYEFASEAEALDMALTCWKVDKYWSVTLSKDNPALAVGAQVRSIARWANGE